MPSQQNISRIDHVFVTVSPGNFQPCIDKLTQVLGVRFQGPIRRDGQNTQAAVDWEAGIEVLAPIREEGPLWEQIQNRGEGQMGVVFGVADLDKAREKAAAEGIRPLMNVGLDGDEPWFDQFETVEETVLTPIFGANIVLGEIVPK